MTLVRSVTSRSSVYWYFTIQRRLRQDLSFALSLRRFSTTRSPLETGNRDNGKPGVRVRYLEQVGPGKLINHSSVEGDTTVLKARIEELEKEIRQYAKKQGTTNANPNQVFGDIFDRMPDDLRPERISRQKLKAMIKDGDPEAMKYEGAQQLAKDLAEGDEEDYEIDKILERMPQETRSGFTRDQMRKMIEQDHPSIQDYLVEEVTYDLDRTYDRLPVQLKGALTKDQVRSMIANQDPVIETYLCEVKTQYDHDKVYRNLPRDKKAMWTKEKVHEMVDNEDPAIRDYLPGVQNHDAGLEHSNPGINAQPYGDNVSENGDGESLHVGIPDHVKVHMNSFNKAMRDVASQSKDPKSVGLLWARYELCKKYVPGFVEEIPPQVWNILWLSQWAGNAIHESRKRHLWTLVNDMVDVEHPLNQDQTLVYIEYEFSEGNKSAAMKIWRREYSKLPNDDPKRDDYRDLGVRLHVESGLLVEAQELTFAKQKGTKVRAADVAVLVAAKASQHDEANLKIAWSFYLDMRERLGDKIKLDDFDQIAMTFLGANKPNLALAVFKDMVLSARSQSQSLGGEIRSLGLLQQLQERANNKEELERISLETLASIPKQLENKYFYASWLKRLIGLGEVDATIQVLQLMSQRGVRPDARHLNGIIGAWLRGPDKDKHQLALQIAWSMANERLNFVARRNNSVSGSMKIVDMIDDGKTVPQYISQNLPSANIETFCLLLLYYQRRSMIQSVDKVTQYLQQAEIAPNSFFMNHLIFAELRKQNIGKAWKIYDSGKGLVTPDLETFSALWSCEKVFTTGRSAGAPEFPRSRRMFAIMSQWFHGLQGRSLKQTLEAFSKEMYNEIIRCFCFQKDVEGTIVALYGLRNMFDAYPHTETERIILIQLARMGEGPVARRKRTRSDQRFSANPNSLQDFAKITKIANLVKEERVQALKDNGIEDSALKGRERNEEDLYRIVEVLKISQRHQAGLETNQGASQEQRLGMMCEEMGVTKINMHPPEISLHE